MLRVTCAIIQFNAEILAVQRSERMSLPLKWEFPGGKIEADESEEACILREIKEELNIEISIIRKLSPVLHNYPQKQILLIPFLTSYKSGQLELREHKQYKLMNKAELLKLDWAEADLPIVKELQSL